MGRGLGKIQRKILQVLSQYLTGLRFSELKSVIPEDISKTKGLKPSYSRRPRPTEFPQRWFDHNIYMALKGLQKRGLIEIDPYMAKDRLHRITQRGYEYIQAHAP